MTEKTIIPEKLNLALNNLAEKIKFSEPVNNYQTTLEQFTQDAESQKIMKDLSAVQKVVRQKQGGNQITQQDLQELRSLQSKAQENQVIIFLCKFTTRSDCASAGDQRGDQQLAWR